MLPRYPQAHPELNYEYGRKVMEGMLGADAAHGRLTHEEAARLKEQVLTEARNVSTLR